MSTLRHCSGSKIDDLPILRFPDVNADYAGDSTKGDPESLGRVDSRLPGTVRILHYNHGVYFSILVFRDSFECLPSDLHSVRRGLADSGPHGETVDDAAGNVSNSINRAGQVRTSSIGEVVQEL